MSDIAVEPKTQLSEREARQLFKLLAKFHDALEPQKDCAQQDIVRVVRKWLDWWADDVLHVDLTEKPHG